MTPDAQNPAIDGWEPCEPHPRLVEKRNSRGYRWRKPVDGLAGAWIYRTRASALALVLPNGRIIKSPAGSGRGSLESAERALRQFAQVAG